MRYKNENGSISEVLNMKDKESELTQDYNKNNMKHIENMEVASSILINKNNKGFK
jgi:hypothetical protein